MADRVALLGVGAALPPQIRSSAEVEALIEECSPNFRLRPGTLASISGVETRRVACHDVQCSDLAAFAARRALDVAGVGVDDVDLLIFASAGQDLIEPATANIVQEKLGTACQAFDVKNACNSFLNGLQLAESLILSGACERAVVTSGEVCSRAISWRVRHFEDFKRNFPGYTMGDAGAAAVLGRSRDGRGIFYRRFVTISDHWRLATVPCGGSRHPRGEEFTYLRADGKRLKQAFIDLGPDLIPTMMREAGVTFSDFSRILIHQATLPYLHEMLDITGIPPELVEFTVSEFGNMASASLPVGYVRALERGAMRPGDRVMWLGLASGISVGMVMIDV
ncbi:MAG TPA: 3-oxoacyl-[acyl-carrier-protein] synthase III C-terminal domain-containing protein [Gemmatimonadaceae bacterium]|nr:3-oxoacyl-[acyl-carrier-protein] synthase III C-terminal domain-containing protein [Gemmatimonadaceae bacterium]